MDCTIARCQDLGSGSTCKSYVIKQTCNSVVQEISGCFWTLYFSVFVSLSMNQTQVSPIIAEVLPWDVTLLNRLTSLQEYKYCPIVSLLRLVLIIDAEW